ncbi:hypothetical protein Tco_0928513 [Tanacetum coccineum]
MEIKLPEDLKEIPTKLETFTISSLTSQVAELKNIQWELPSEFLDFPSQETTSPAEGDKNTNPATRDAKPTNMHNELVDLLGIDIMTQYYNKKLLYDKYCDKMLKRRKSSKIINYDVLTQKGPIALHVYREDEIVEVIPNVKVSDLHLAEWKEVVQACPERKEKEWKTIYGLIKTRMEYLNQTKKELRIDFNKPLKEQDPLNELNDLANKKRKRSGDSKDHSSFSSLGPWKIGKYLHSSLCSGSETEKGLCKELQFSLVDNSKLNVVDSFACPALFLWHTAKNVTRDPAPVTADFNEQDYATLVTHPSPFQKFPEEFLCLVGLSCHYTLDEETYPRRTVHLFPVAPDRAESELEASVDKLFYEGGSGNQAEQGDSVGGGQGANIQPIVEVAAPVQPRRQAKRKSVVVDAGGASHPPKKLREDHGTPGGTSVGGKSHSAIKRLLAGAVLNAEVGVAAILTLPFVTASVSSMPEHEAGDHTDSVGEPNICTIGASQRFVISSDSSHHSGPTVAEAEVDSLARSSVPLMTTVTTVTAMVDPTLVVKEKPTKPSLFSADSSSAGGADPNTGIFLDLYGSDFLVGGIRTMVDEFAPPKFFASIRGMEHDQLFTEFNIRAARQMSLSAEVRMRAEYNVKERRRLKSVVEEKDELLKAKDEEIKNLKAQILLKEAEAA